MASDHIRGLARGLSVLSAIEREPGLRLHELHLKTGLPKPSLLRVLATLEAAGYIRRRVGDGTWRRAARNSGRASSYVEDLLVDIAGEELDRLCQQIAWPSDVMVHDHGVMRMVETTRRLTPFVVNHPEIGLRVSMLETGVGRAWLAFCGDEERERILAALRASAAPWDWRARDEGYVNAVIAEVQAKGYGVRDAAYTAHNETPKGLTTGIGLPVFAAGRIVACINIVWVAAAMDEATVVRLYLPRLRDTATRIGRRVEARLIA